MTGDPVIERPGGGTLLEDLHEAVHLTPHPAGLDALTGLRGDLDHLVAVDDDDLLELLTTLQDAHDLVHRDFPEADQPGDELHDQRPEENDDDDPGDPTHRVLHDFLQRRGSLEEDVHKHWKATSARQEDSNAASRRPAPYSRFGNTNCCSSRPGDPMLRNQGSAVAVSPGGSPPHVTDDAEQGTHQRDELARHLYPKSLQSIRHPGSRAGSYDACAGSRARPQRRRDPRE